MKGYAWRNDGWTRPFNGHTRGQSGQSDLPPEHHFSTGQHCFGCTSYRTNCLLRTPDCSRTLTKSLLQSCSWPMPCSILPNSSPNPWLLWWQCIALFGSGIGRWTPITSGTWLRLPLQGTSCLELPWILCWWRRRTSGKYCLHLTTRPNFNFLPFSAGLQFGDPIGGGWNITFPRVLWA